VWQYEDIFENGIYNFIADRENPYIIDCGANIGLSLLYFKKLYPNSMITAFEADPMIFEIYKRNINNFYLKNIFLYNYALWEYDGIIFFKTEGGDSGCVVDEYSNSHKISVKAVKLSEYIIAPVDF